MKNITNLFIDPLLKSLDDFECDPSYPAIHNKLSILDLDDNMDFIIERIECNYYGYEIY